MDFLLTVVAFLVIFSVLVLIHEWGHFFVARKAGIKVEEFGFGLPPRIWGKKKGETLYSINAIPFGGFVRLLGEDSRDPKALKDKRSFASKPARVRIAVIVAGVFMNFVLAWLLLTIGFTFGIQPLLVNGDEVLAGINDGMIKTRQGIIIKEVKDLSPASQSGLQPGDRIISVNGIDADSSVSADPLKAQMALAEKPLRLDVERDGVVRRYEMVNDKLGSGIGLYEVMFLPRIVIGSVKEGSGTDIAGVLPRDVVLQINGQPVYFLDDYYNALQGQNRLELMLMRGSDIVNTVVNLPQGELTVISNIFPDTPAAEAGFMRDDLIVSVNGEKVSNPGEVVAITQDHPTEALTYVVRRAREGTGEGEEVSIDVTATGAGQIGVGLSTIVSHENSEMSVYAADFPVSVLKIEDVRYPFWVA
ncbi:MAG TPA: site-2 protease family protein, partial [Candidatus Gracilibacteria bacterium]|nr:site-2 protease family protein [Candidatus Gracilibacteria bacterium]